MGESLDLTEARSLIDTAPLADVTAAVESSCRAFRRRRGFIHAGDLQPLDETYLAAAELEQVAAAIDRGLRVTDAEEYHFLDLLAGADEGNRPDPDAVPPSLWPARGLGYARALETYRSDCRRYLDDNPDPDVRRELGRVGEQLKRITALDGDVDPRPLERLVAATQDLGRALRDGDEDALAMARDRLDGFELHGPER